MIPNEFTSTANVKTKRKDPEVQEIIMPVEVNPKEISRASAYELWMHAPNPMVTFYLTVSFQFHHTQMDGAHAGRFLENLQKAMNELRNQL